jgi:signal transduction histidine kinase
MLTGQPAPPASAAVERERVWRLVVRLLAHPPRRARRPILWILVVWAILFTAQAWDVSGRSGPQVIAESLGMPSGSAAMMLLVVAMILMRSSELASCDAAGAPSPALDRMRLALPALGFVAGVLATFAIGMFVMRALLGAPLAFVVSAIAAHLLVLWLAARTVSDTTAFLYAHARERAAAAARAEGEATAAQLSALQAQLHPHFLFNALNTVASLVRTDARAAERTVENLSEVLRRTLARSRETLRTVDDEVEYLRAYLAVEQERWDERLTVDWAIEPDTLKLPLPPMTLQPIVENALRHGIGPRLEGGRIRIDVRCKADSLILAVEDNGVGFPRTLVEGTGLGNLRRRLATLYGDRAALTIERLPEGACVAVRVPIAAAPQAAPEGG